MSNHYDSSVDTLNHIKRVSNLLHKFVKELLGRADNHDASKLRLPEKEVFDAYTPKLKETTYGSDEYKKHLVEMKKGLKHHYEMNYHHPEHYPSGVDSMDLVDLMEMFCDWKAATERNPGGDILKSIDINAKRFKLSPQLESIFLCTAQRYF